MRALLGSLLLSLTIAAAAHAQPSDGARAIEKGKDALALYEAGNWSGALEAFREADTLFHSPVFALYTARSLRQLGRLLEARAALERLSNETLSASAPAPWLKAQADARLELE